MAEQNIIRQMAGLKQTSGLFVVVIPTYNREEFIGHALSSLELQTYDKWAAVVLDDGSTDNTERVVKAHTDPRIFYARYEENRGGVAMNEIGMRLACEFGEFWTRLGSDDWFDPQKLERDYKALCANQGCAVYGPFRAVRGGIPAETCNPEEPADQLKRELTYGIFKCGWANVAVPTAVLRAVQARFGRFCDPRLRNMEDFLVNSRIARVANWVWRDGCDGYWRAARPAPGEVSASANSTQTHKDLELTLQIIRSTG